MELNRVTRERDALRAEVERLRGAENLAAAIESLQSLATRSFREFDNARYHASEAEPLDKPVDLDDELDCDSSPTITLSFDLADVPEPWSAHVRVWVPYDPNDDDSDFIAISVALGLPSASPSGAVASLRTSLEGDADADGFRVPDELRDASERPSPPDRRAN